MEFDYPCLVPPSCILPHQEDHVQVPMQDQLLLGHHAALLLLKLKFLWPSSLYLLKCSYLKFRVMSQELFSLPQLYYPAASAGRQYQPSASSLGPPAHCWQGSYDHSMATSCVQLSRKIFSQTKMYYFLIASLLGIFITISTCSQKFP